MSLDVQEALALCEALTFAPDVGKNERAAIELLLRLARGGTPTETEAKAAIVMLLKVREIVRSLRNTSEEIAARGPDGKERSIWVRLVLAPISKAVGLMSDDETNIEMHDLERATRPTPCGCPGCLIKRDIIARGARRTG